MAPPTRCNYVKGVVICHGKSELLMTRHITSNLHLNVKPYARDKGSNSIQITSLMTVLKAKPFDKPTSFLEAYPVESKGRGKKIQLINFKLFIIMDTDDCTEVQKNDYISGAMFADHWLKEYIVPIYSIDSLEDVMIESGIMKKRIKDDEKGPFYTKIFPISKVPFSNDTLNEVRLLRQKIEKSKKTNLISFIDYCLSLIT